MWLNQITALMVSHLRSAESRRYRAWYSSTCILTCTAARVTKYIPCPQQLCSLPADHKIDTV